MSRVSSLVRGTFGVYKGETLVARGREVILL